MSGAIVNDGKGNFNALGISGSISAVANRKERDKLMALGANEIHDVNLVAGQPTFRGQAKANTSAGSLNAGSKLQADLTPIFRAWLLENLASPYVTRPWCALDQNLLVVNQTKSPSIDASTLIQELCLICAPKCDSPNEATELLLVKFSVTRKPGSRLSHDHAPKLDGALSVFKQRDIKATGMLLVVDVQELAPCQGVKGESRQYTGNEFGATIDFLEAITRADGGLQPIQPHVNIIPFSAFRDNIAGEIHADRVQRAVKRYEKGYPRQVEEGLARQKGVIGGAFRNAGFSGLHL